MNKPDLSVNIAGIHFNNPFMNASGCFDPKQMCKLRGMNLSHLGALVTKGTTLHPRPGNVQPRIKETKNGMINFIGLENPGLEAFMEDENLLWLSQFGVPIIANLSGFDVQDYVLMAQKFNTSPYIAGLEINISCPNVKGGGIFFGSDPFLAAKVVSSVRKITPLPLIVKLTPNVTDITLIAEAVVEAGADAISLINTVRAGFIDEQGKIIFGGLSGPAIKPIALAMVSQTAQAVSVPIIGMGGINCLEDVFDFFKVGASAVAVGTAHFKNPLILMELVEELDNYCQQNGIRTLAQITGAKK